jgi:hypothetical protein
MNHVLYGFIAGFKSRCRLAAILRSAPAGVTVVAISPEQLKLQGIKVVALDFDGVLAPHGRTEPLPEAGNWLSRCCAVFGEEMVFILSNKPTQERREWFQSRHPGVRFISGVRKKPYPDGLDQVIRISGVQPHEVTLLDDRLLTGVLATCLAGTRVVYINAPYVDLAGNPFKELFFILLRTVERILLSLS